MSQSLLGSRPSSRSSGEDERQGLTNSFRGQSGYGTAPLSANTKKLTPVTRRFISRKVQRTETIQGLALKYGTSIQDLKKENKLWNTDHLFLLDSLLIPLTSDNEAFMDQHDSIIVTDGRSSSFTSSNGSEASEKSSASPAAVLDPQQLTSHLSPSSVKDRLSPSARASPAPTDSGGDADDFFSKYDSSIARLKGEVARMENSSAHLEGLLDSNPLALPPRHSSNPTRQGSTTSIERRSRYVTDDESSPVLFIRSRTNTREVKSTIEKSQMADDELFEL